MEVLYCVKLMRLQLLNFEEVKQIFLEVVFTVILADALETKARYINLAVPFFSGPDPGVGAGFLGL